MTSGGHFADFHDLHDISSNSLRRLLTVDAETGKGSHKSTPHFFETWVEAR